MRKHFARLYKEIRDRPYCYVMSKQGRSFKGLPTKKLNIFEQGNSKLYFDKEYETEIIAKSNNSMFVSENALEAVRIVLNRILTKQLGKNMFYFIICKKPHQILRYHKQPTSGAVDRISQGMRLAFGHPFARAAKIMESEVVFKLYLSKVKNLVELKKLLLRNCNSRLPTTVKFSQVKFSQK